MSDRKGDENGESDAETVTGAALGRVQRNLTDNSVVIPREPTARALSFWLVVTFALSVAAYVLVAAGLSIYVVSTDPAKLDDVMGSLGKWAATISTLLAAPIGFVLGHYFKSEK